ncbi:hypothetical protein ACJJTC_006927 [Scirpophaga incertulas]
MNSKECCYMVVDAWDLIERKTLNKAWNKILNRENENLITKTDDSILKEINELMLKIQICQDCDDDDMKEWVTCDSDEGIIRELWMRRLSPEVQRILTAQRDLSLEKVAEIADAIAETPSTAPQAVYTAQSSSSLSELDCIKQAVLELTRKLNAVSSIMPPEAFDFDASKWSKWRRRFTRYLTVSDNSNKEDKDKIDLLLYLMGEKA